MESKGTGKGTKGCSNCATGCAPADKMVKDSKPKKTSGGKSGKTTKK